MEDVFVKYESASDRINALRNKSISVPSWSTLLKDYDPKQHEIVNDVTRIRNRKLKNGTEEEAARIYIGLEKLLVSRYTDFTFSIPVRRVYHGIEDNAKRKEVQDIIEKIYKYARIDTENIKRGRAYYASCEFCTVWYTVKTTQPNTLYGFKSNYKLKCKTYSPMEGVLLYPLFDEYGDMVAMSFEYKQKEGNEEFTYFETYTATRHVKWKSKGGVWEEQLNDKDVALLYSQLGKIPAVYAFRPTPVYDGLTVLRSELEYSVSRNANTIAYNSAPILKVSGAVEGQEQKDETYRMLRTENGGDVSYVSWNQSVESLKYQDQNLLKLFFMQAQMPDISADRMMALGNIGFDARQTILTDAHLKIGEESGALIETLERELNVIKAFVKLMRTDLATEVDNVEVEHIITPFIQNDEKSEIQKWSAACGGKAVMSQQSAIKNLGYTPDAAEEMKLIQQEEAQSTASKMQSVFGGGSAE